MKKNGIQYWEVWSDDELSLLRLLYPTAPQEQIEREIHRSWKAIRRKASEEGIRRKRSRGNDFIELMTGERIQTREKIVDEVEQHHRNMIRKFGEAALQEHIEAQATMDSRSSY